MTFLTHEKSRIFGNLSQMDVLGYSNWDLLALLLCIGDLLASDYRVADPQQHRLQIAEFYIFAVGGQPFAQ